MPTERRVSRRGDGKLDTRPDRRIARLAEEQWGVVALVELVACGLSLDQIDGRLRAGHLHRLHRGVFAVGHAAVPVEGRFLAAVKACGPRAVLSHFSAAALYGFVTWDDRYPQVTVAGAGTRVQRGVRVHRTRFLDPQETRRHRGIPITSPARTLLDLASILEHRALRRAVNQAQSLQLVSIGQLTEILGRLAPRRGAARLARIVATGAAPTRSELEDAVLDLILRGGLERPDVNVPLMIDGRRVIPDFRWPARRLIVEADGAAWHDHRIAREDDAERQALLEAHGERVLRVTWSQAITKRAETLARIRAAGAPIRLE